MNKNLIENAVSGIEFNEESKQRILEGVDLKKNKISKMYVNKIRMGICVAAMICLIVSVSAILGEMDKTVITVYAMTQDGDKENTVLAEESKVTLQLTETPVGYVYIFEVDIPEGRTYECKPVGINDNIFTVYQMEDNIYWIPGEGILGNVYNGENDKLLTDNFQPVEECYFEIIIYNKNKSVVENKIIEFELVNGNCNVTLKNK